MGHFSPEDMRDPSGISGHYTLSAPKYRWPNKTVYWSYDPVLSNFSKYHKNHKLGDKLKD